MHGSAWEWCLDVYDPEFYARSPTFNPCNRSIPGVGRPRTRTVPHHVIRGGSLHALAEMCRTRYRLHEPADFWASDLGFRLARDASPDDPSEAR
jgi:formylglycine-generating enzyme required for sulfatase activity